MYNEIQHSAKGSTWTKKNHKYIRKEGNRYIYPSDQDTHTRNFLKGHKLIEKDVFTGKMRRSSNNLINVKNRNDNARFIRNAERQNQEFNDRVKRNNEQHIQKANQEHYKFLTQLDKQKKEFNDHVTKMADPKYIKSMFDSSKKLLNRSLDEISKEGKLGNWYAKSTRKRLNSKQYDVMTSILSKIGSVFMKSFGKKIIEQNNKDVDKMKKKTNENHKEYVLNARKQSNQFIKKSTSSQKRFSNTAKSSNKQFRDFSNSRW